MHVFFMLASIGSSVKSHLSACVSMVSTKLVDLGGARAHRKQIHAVINVRDAAARLNSFASEEMASLLHSRQDFKHPREDGESPGNVSWSLNQEMVCLLQS